MRSRMLVAGAAAAVLPGMTVSFTIPPISSRTPRAVVGFGAGARVGAGVGAGAGVGVGPIDPKRFRHEMLPDPSVIGTAAASFASTATTSVTTHMDALASDSTFWTAFSDQGQNLAGIFFQASLLPYLAFLYFLGRPANRAPALGKFGFAFLLLFVLSTIPSGIVTKATYGETLADCDWLHGGAEALLTVTNVLIVFGFRNAMLGAKQQDEDEGSSFEEEEGLLRKAAFATAAAFAVACSTGPAVGFGDHSAFLLGLGNLPDFMVNGFEWASHPEPTNALSIPTWAIHFSSVLEYLFAMGLVWSYADATGNERWKGVAWGMLPNHASGLAACTYHFFYNDPSLQILVTTQAGLTLLGNLTLMVAAYRLAESNGWTPTDVLSSLPFRSRSPTSVDGILEEELAARPLMAIPQTIDTIPVLVSKVVGLTLVLSYLVKYGELALDLPFNPSTPVALSMVVLPASVTAGVLYSKSQGLGANWELPSFGSMGDNNGNGNGTGLTMADVKQYGVAGTLSYILTELAFWAVAFPVAATAYYQTAGHWPDLLTSDADRTTVLASVFAGANVARLLVPLRLGAALALAPWVDQNIVQRFANSDSDAADKA